MKRTGYFLFAAILFLTLAFGSGCGSKPSDDKSALERIRDKGFMTVGTSPDYPPFESIDDKGNIIGFDIDLIKAIAAKIGVEVKLMSMGFDSIIIAVKNGQVDVGMSSFSVNEERKASIDFSIPYIVSSQVILAGKDSDIKNAGELDGKVVAAAVGTTGAEAAKEIKGAVLKTVDDYNIAMMMLDNGSVKAVVLDVAIAREYSSKRGFKILEKPLNHEETAVVIMKGKDSLTEEINKAIETVKQDGTYDELLKKWKI